MVSKRLGLADVKAKRDWVEAPNQHAWVLRHRPVDYIQRMPVRLRAWTPALWLQYPAVLVEYRVSAVTNKEKCFGVCFESHCFM
jgi:hypothetical protein